MKNITARLRKLERGLSKIMPQDADIDIKENLRAPVSKVDKAGRTSLPIGQEGDVYFRIKEEETGLTYIDLYGGETFVIEPIPFEESRSEMSAESAPEITREEAKEHILHLFEEKGELDYYDLMVELGLDLDLVIEICEELVKERRIEEIG